MRGHLKERGHNHWAIVLDARDPTGRRKRRWHAFHGTKREAQIECARLIAEAERRRDRAGTVHCRRLS
jgi:hypothetical protein